jgi:TonB family protein
VLRLVASSAVHGVAISLLLIGGVSGVVVDRFAVSVPPVASETASTRQVDVQRLVFILRDPVRPASGGGGGGNRQTAPIRMARGIGSDPMTLRTVEPTPRAPEVSEVSPVPSMPPMPPSVASIPILSVLSSLPQVALDARSLASGTSDQPGLPTGGVPYGTSTGPGSGGGVGEGVGTGIGPGRGPGVGPGSGGGIGGGVYRAGGSVTPPRVLTEVKPTYTNDALARKVQGTVVLELVVRHDGRPTGIHVIQSLDPGGLDEQSVAAAGQWRFEPGRLAGTPVNVVVTIGIDFWIH